MEPSDEQVEQFIKDHPNGGTLDEIAAVLGVSRQRALQIVNLAIERAVAYLQRRGIKVHDLMVD